MRSRSPSTRKARDDQIKGNHSPWAIGSETHGLPTALSQHKKNQEDRARICFFKGFKPMLILLRQEMRRVWPASLGRHGGRAQPDTPVTCSPSQGCGSPYTSSPAGHSRRAADSTVLVRHTARRPPVRARGGGAALCGHRRAATSPAAQATFPVRLPLSSTLLLGAHTSRGKHFSFSPLSLLSRERRPRPGDVIPTSTQNQPWMTGWLR